jgi:GNAT superfamily N-acetyltransferase
MPEDRATLFAPTGFFAARLYPERDTAALQTLLEACADFSDLVEGLPPGATAAREAFEETPPGKAPDDKFLVGLFDAAGNLTGVLDAIRDYPEPGEWFIGLLLLHPDRRGHGAGQRIYGAFEAWAAGSGARSIGLAVVEANERAYRFWQRMGFGLVRTTPLRRFGQKEHAVRYMRRELP